LPGLDLDLPNLRIVLGSIILPEKQRMTRLALIALLALAALIPPRQAAAQDALGGAIFGGAAGAILGGVLGGGRGAAVGAVLGATTGAAVASQGQPRPGGYYYYQNGCYLPQPDGSYVVVDPAYCNGPPPGPPPRYYARESYGPPCTRSPTFDPRDGTFIDRYGYRRRCI
jgi:hypothetical protein